MEGTKSNTNWNAFTVAAFGQRQHKDGVSHAFDDIFRSDKKTMSEDKYIPYVCARYYKHLAAVSCAAHTKGN